MIRSDFVSNSSSSSFVISNIKSIVDDLHNGNRDFLKFLYMVPHNYRASYDNGSIIFRKNGPECWDNFLLYNIPETSAIKNKSDSPNEIEIKDLNVFKDPDTLSEDDFKIMIQLIENSDEIDFDFGLDDTGEKAALVSCVLTLILYKYNGIKADSENFDVDRVISKVEMLKEER